MPYGTTSGRRLDFWGEMMVWQRPLPRRGTPDTPRSRRLRAQASPLRLPVSRPLKPSLHGSVIAPARRRATGPCRRGRGVRRGRVRPVSEGRHPGRAPRRARDRSRETLLSTVPRSGSHRERSAQQAPRGGTGQGPRRLCRARPEGRFLARPANKARESLPPNL